MEEQVKHTLLQIAEITPSPEALDSKVFLKAFQVSESQFDPIYGGFGGAPKFPNSMTLSFLLRYWKSTGSKKALEMVEKTLEQMARGGIYDHLGGGFHRYSTDARWLIPHFEKMLYDNALLSRTYFEAYQATHKEGYRHIGEEILHYIMREMKSTEGGFYSTEDADSDQRPARGRHWRLSRFGPRGGNHQRPHPRTAVSA